MNAHFAMIGCLFWAAPTSDHLPSRLRAALNTGDVETSEVEWNLSWLGGYDDGLVERHITRTAGDTVWEANLGDSRGRHSASFLQSPSPYDSDEEIRRKMVPRDVDAGVRNKLLTGGWAWYLEHAERPLMGYASPLDKAAIGFPANPRVLGLSPGPPHDSNSNSYGLSDADFEGFEDATFQESWENGYPTVTAAWGDQRSIKWRFDNRQGGMPVEASFYRADRLANHSETEYQRIGERWFPQSASYYDRESPDPFRLVDVQKATFDEPWHMEEITPSDIGALGGTQFGGSEGTMWWTGAELLPNDEFLELLYLDDGIMDERIAELMVEGTTQSVEQYRASLRKSGDALRERLCKEYGSDPQAPKSGGEKDEWDAYVDEFLHKNELPDPAVKRAHAALTSAKRVRDAQRLRYSADVKKAQRNGDKKRIAQFDDREMRVFDRMLKRPLERLARIAESEKKSAESAPP